jgi:hypothetical protein
VSTSSAVVLGRRRTAMSDMPALPEIEIVDPCIRQLYDYWLSKRGERRYPARAEIDPLDFRYALGDVTLVEVGADRRSFTYRLHGSNLSARDGYDLTGKTLEAIPEAEYRERVRRGFTIAVDTGAPRHGIRDIVVDGRRRCFEYLILPLASDGNDIDMLLSVQRYIKRPAS